MDKKKEHCTDWRYVSYEKISENPNKWNLPESDYRTFKKTDWVVTEKIHGANFGIVTNGSEVRFAKRKEFLAPEEDFFDYQSLHNQLAEQVREIFNILQAERNRLVRIYLYGELFGGEYPHPDVPGVPDVQAVQTGIYYSPKIEYCAFDIAIEENDTLDAQYYQDYDKAIHIFQQVVMMCAEPLFIGKYEEALTYNLGFDSTIPALFGLPKLPFKNPAEGIIVKPIKSIYIKTSKGLIRPILKIKIPEFAEDSRFHQATKWTNQKAPSFTTRTSDLSIEEELSQEMLALVTARRLNNVISKIGRVSGSDAQKKQQLIQLLMQDVLETFNEEWESIFGALSNKSQETMRERLHQESHKLVESYFNSC